MRMKIHALLITSGLLFAITGAAMADDHLFNAGIGVNPVQHNSAQHPTAHFANSTASGRSQVTKNDPLGTGKGQGSPFVGNDQATPSNDNGRANPTEAEKTTPSKPAGQTAAPGHTPGGNPASGH